MDFPEIKNKVKKYFKKIIIDLTKAIEYEYSSRNLSAFVRNPKYEVNKEGR